MYFVRKCSQKLAFLNTKMGKNREDFLMYRHLCYWYFRSLHLVSGVPLDDGVIIISEVFIWCAIKR